MTQESYSTLLNVLSILKTTTETDVAQLELCMPFLNDAKSQLEKVIESDKPNFSISLSLVVDDNSVRAFLGSECAEKTICKIVKKGQKNKEI